jgi:hypothetical protein
MVYSTGKLKSSKDRVLLVLTHWKCIIYLFGNQYIVGAYTFLLKWQILTGIW